MKSPFPGMDPYVESSGLWEDFHEKFIGDIERALSDALPERYTVRLAERSYIALEKSRDEEIRHSQGDVTVLVSKKHTETLIEERATAVLEAVTTEPPPVTMKALIEEEYRETYVEIWSRRPARRLVTTIEVLSPTNKRFGSLGWEQYLQKRHAHLMGRANFVELDLLRAGTRMPMDGQWPDSPYYALVYRKHPGRRCTVWHAEFARPLPVIPIPLAPPDTDFALHLQPLVDQVYRRSRYARDIDYRQPCRPRLAPAEAKWLEKQLRELKRKK